LQGWSISRHSLAKLELGLRRVSDCELFFLAPVLRLDLRDLFPRHMQLKEIGPAFQGEPLRRDWGRHRSGRFDSRSEADLTHLQSDMHTASVARTRLGDNAGPALRATDLGVQDWPQ